MQTIRQDDTGTYLLATGTFHVAIEPAKRRITSLRRTDGSNLLYVNPTAKPGKPGEHVAWGGEKAWLWPQDRWRDGKSNWPPPMDLEGLPYSVDHISDSDGLICTYGSDGVGGGLRRHYTIDRNGKLVVQSTLHFGPEQSTESANGWGIWTIAQIKRPERLFARILPGASPAPVPLPPFGADRLLTVSLVGDGVVEIETGGDAPRKVGLEADRFAAWYPDGTVLLVDQLPLPPETPPYRAGERSQVYSNPATAADPSYIEIEFTAPLTPPGRSPLPLTVSYSIQKAKSPEDATRLLNR